MAYIENLDEINSKLNAEDVITLLQPDRKFSLSGKELRTCCPVHQGNGVGNFAINTETLEWCCHSKGCRGRGLINLYAQSVDMGVPEAARVLAERFGIPVELKGLAQPLETKHVPARKPPLKPKAEKKKNYPYEDVIKCWENASEIGQDLYFSRKGLLPPPIARFGKNPSGFPGVLIPYQDIEGNLKMVLSLVGDGKFNFKAADSYSEAFALLGSFEEAKTFFVGEGIATVQTAWESFNAAVPAISVGSWTNLLPVVSYVKEKYPGLEPVVLIDKGEVGEKAAEKLKREFPDAVLAKPNFDGLQVPEGKHPTDFNDIISVCDGNLGNVKTQLQDALSMIECINEIKNDQEIDTTEKETTTFPITSIEERLKNHNKHISKYRGKKYIGLKTKTITDFNEKMKGLRKLILLAAAPNVGKTALAVQLATEVLLEEQDACLVFISLEMTSEEIFTRINLYLSELTFDSYVLGNGQDETPTDFKDFFTEKERNSVEGAHNQLSKLGNRLQILDGSETNKLTAEYVINYIENLKEKTGCSRVMVVIDYLQVWPVPEGQRFTSDNSEDKWRVGQIKKIRDAINTDTENPVLVISEARKPSSNNDNWGGDLSDVMGSARTSYTPDAVLLFQKIPEEDLLNLWKSTNMPGLKTNNEKEQRKEIINLLAENGISLCRLSMPKARDGMQRFEKNVAFKFRQNRIEPINWLEIKKIAE